MKFTHILAAGLTSLALAVPAFAQEVLVTSSGQSLDAFTVRTMLSRSGVTPAYDPLATVDMLEGNSTLVIAVGASVKGFGAAGITADVEAARTADLIAAAQAAGIKIIAVHVGGLERRGGQSEQFIDMVAQAADAIVVTEDGNEDGYFTTVAEERDIPITIIEQPALVGGAVAELIE